MYQARFYFMRHIRKRIYSNPYRLSYIKHSCVWLVIPGKYPYIKHAIELRYNVCK